MAMPLAFFDVDTQFDFMDPRGSLYVQGAQAIRARLQQLITYAGEHSIPILSSADAHASDDPSFAEWPPHCVLGTDGQRRIPETQLPNAHVVPNRPGAFEAPREWPAQIIIEKQEYDAATNVNFGDILQALGRRHFIVFGVATEYCVRSTVLSLLKTGCVIQVVTDAIQAIDETAGHKTLEELRSAGAEFTTTAVVCK
jgi:nicotinamidase/pyrazinamidase